MGLDTLPVCSFQRPVGVLFVFLLQIAIESFAFFHHSVFDYMCFTVVLHR